MGLPQLLSVEDLDDPSHANATAESWEFDGTNLIIVLDGRRYSYKPDIVKVLQPKVEPSDTGAVHMWRIGFVGPALENDLNEKQCCTVEIAQSGNEIAGKEIFGLVDSDGGYVQMAKGHHMAQCTYSGTGTLG